MTRSLAIAHPMASDDAVVTASSEASSSMSVQQLQTMQPRESWRADNLVDLYIEIDFGALFDRWNLLLLLFSNAGSADTWRVRTADSQGALTASPSYDSGSTLLWFSDGSDDELDYLNGLDYVHSMLWLGDESARTERWMRLDFTITAPKLPAGYVGDPFFQVGRLYASHAYRPPYDKNVGYTVRQRERGAKRTTTFNGGMRVRRGTTFRETNFTVGFLTRAESLAEPWIIHQLRGESSDIVVIEDPEEQSANLMKTLFYGLASPMQSKHRGPDVHDLQYKLETLEG